MSATSKVLTPKEKKALKNAENAKKEAVRDALNKQIKDIYAIPDLLEAVPKLKSFNKNDLNLRIEVVPIDKLHHETFQWVFDLLKKNMEKYYEQTWGWSDSGKRAELKEFNALYLIAWETVDGKEVPVGYSHFRFDYEDEKKANVLYMYELQLEERARGKGLVFLCNKDAMAFYQKMKYEVDSTSPSKDIKIIVADTDNDYEILSKTFRR